MAVESYVGVRIQGGLLPAALLSWIATGTLAGQTSSDYHLAAGETVREAANRSWAYLTGVWATYRQAAENLPEADRGTTLTRERWLLILLRELGYGRVPATPAGGIVVGDRHFPISHEWEIVPVHLLGLRVDLDRRTHGVAGAATSSPQSMVQELLNLSDAHLWAILSNGLTLRLLRDSTSLVGSAYIEFDLEAIFDGDLFSDFLLLYNLCHQSRLEVRDAEKGPASCWLEAWRSESLESGSRALNQLRDGVIDAITTLGTGFLANPGNRHLRDGLADGTLRVEDVNHALLRVVYRLLFTFVAEDRGLLLAPDTSVQAKERYLDYFSTARLRRVSLRRRGTRHTDQWRALNLVWDGLGSVDGRPELGLVGIGGLFDPGPLDLFHDCELSNEVLLKAVRHLNLVQEQGSGIRRVVDYRNLGAEELGSIYEALLEYVPSWNPEKRAFELLSASGNDRKSTGSYYTPTSLIDCLLDSALDPVLDRAEREADPETALLKLTVCDPACGSGHFLVAAARRIAKRVAAIRTGDPEPPPERVREALGDVVGRCIYGVDVNPLAAELAKVSLWLETLDPGRPLAFLDAQIKVGNSLMGATPDLIAEGIPDAAFAPLEGDDKKITTALKKKNKAEPSGPQDELFGNQPIRGESEIAAELGQLLAGSRAMSLADIHARQQQLKAMESNPRLQRQRLVADSWCAAFVWPKQPGAPAAVTDRVLRTLERGEPVPTETSDTVRRLATQYQFFHWHLEYPHLFRGASTAVGPDWRGGFDVVLGNPPWERVKLQEQEFFAVRDPEIASAPNTAARKRLIQKLADTNPAFYEEYLAALRRAAGESHILRNSGLYPLAGRGDINTYAVFAERGRNLVAERGRLGLILPTGIATDATTQYFFKDLVQKGSLASLYDFENRKPLFDGVDSRFKFCLLTLAGPGSREPKAEFAFFAHDPSDLLKEDARFELTPAEIQLLNPNTGTCPIFRSRRDADLAITIARIGIPLNAVDPSIPDLAVKVRRIFDMGKPSGVSLCTTTPDEKSIRMYEGKLFHSYDHRFSTYFKNPDKSLHDSPEEEVTPRYWLKDVATLNEALKPWAERFLIAFRDIARATDERTMIATALPRVATDYTVRLAFPPVGRNAELLALLNTFIFDYSYRLRLGGTHLSDYITYQLPGIKWATFDTSAPWEPRVTLKEWLTARVAELVYTSHEMAPFIQACHYAATTPFPWDEARRRMLRAEIDAAFFRLFELKPRDIEYILESFPIVKRKDEANFGNYQTRDLIMKSYNRMEEAIESGLPYSSLLNSEIGDLSKAPSYE